MCKRTVVILFIILLPVCLFSAVSADNVVKNVTYGETYLCNDAYTIRIITQPQMVYQIIEKLNIDIGYKKTSLAVDNVYYYLYKEKTAQKAPDRLTQQFLNLSKKNAAQRSGRITIITYFLIKNNGLLKMYQS